MKKKVLLIAWFIIIFSQNIISQIYSMGFGEGTIPNILTLKLLSFRNIHFLNETGFSPIDTFYTPSFFLLIYIILFSYLQAQIDVKGILTLIFIRSKNLLHEKIRWDMRIFIKNLSVFLSLAVASDMLFMVLYPQYFSWNYGIIIIYYVRFLMEVFVGMILCDMAILRSNNIFIPLLGFIGLFFADIFLASSLITISSSLVYEVMMMLVFILIYLGMVRYYQRMIIKGEQL